MAQDKKQKYTTIQVKSEFYAHIKTLSDRFGVPISTMTEKLWAQQISSSMSGSLQLWG